MDENFRPHRAIPVQAILEEGNMTKLEWTVNLPVMKPIEKMWELFNSQQD